MDAALRPLQNYPQIHSCSRVASETGERMLIPETNRACGVTGQKKRCWQPLQSVRASDARQRWLLGGHADHAQRQQLAPADASVRKQRCQQKLVPLPRSDPGCNIAPVDRVEKFSGCDVPADTQCHMRCLDSARDSYRASPACVQTRKNKKHSPCNCCSEDTKVSASLGKGTRHVSKHDMTHGWTLAGYD